jgi:hypothetical protein
MIKHVFIGFLNRLNELEATRWYFQYHSKEVVRYVGPWLRRYETYKSYPPPEEAKRFGAVGGFMTELWYNSVADYIEAGADFKTYTPPPGGWNLTLGPVTIVPAVPTEYFSGRDLAPSNIPIVRWCRLIKYPDGIPLEIGEKWYLDTYVKESAQQVGLLKYISHRVLEKPPIRTPWQWVEEFWYESMDAWRRAVIESPPHYSKPSWDKAEPSVDMVSTFVGLKPDVDFLKDNPLIP